MGKASKWFNKLFLRHRRHRKTLLSSNSRAIRSAAFTTCTESNLHGGGGDVAVALDDPNKHAIAVAAATAAVAEAALAAAKAAAEVVRLTTTAPPPLSPSPGQFSRRWSLEDLAAVKIQSAFRGYLARRALRALKGLVKLQALVRGHFVRKQSADMLRRLQALVRVQDRARLNRVQNLESTHCSQDNPKTYEIHPRSEKLEDFSVLKKCGSMGNEKTLLATNWLENWVQVGSSMNSPSPSPKPLKISPADDEKNDKILEVDSWKPNWKPKSRHISVQDYYNHSFASDYYLSRFSPNDVHKPNTSPDVASLKSLRFPREIYTAESSTPPQSLSIASRSGSTRKSPMTPMRDESSRSFFNGYPSPSYMANTESSRAKVRSQSVPRQRGDPEKHCSIKRSLHAFWESKTSSKRSSNPFHD